MRHLKDMFQMTNMKTFLQPIKKQQWSPYQHNHKPNVVVPWDLIAIREKRDNAKKHPKLNKRNPTNANAQKLKKAKRDITLTKKKNKNTYTATSI